MSHYDSYSHNELIARIEALEKRQRIDRLEIKELTDSLDNATKLLFKQNRVQLKLEREKAVKDAEIERLDDLLSKFLVADVLGKTG